MCLDAEVIKSPCFFTSERAIIAVNHSDRFGRPQNKTRVMAVHAASPGKPPHSYTPLPAIA